MILPASYVCRAQQFGRPERRIKVVPNSCSAESIAFALQLTFNSFLRTISINQQTSCQAKMAETPQAFFDNRNSLVHSFPNAAPVTSDRTLQYDSEAKQLIRITSGATITCDSRCMTWSTVSPDLVNGKHQVVDWFLFTHDFQCAPVNPGSHPLTSPSDVHYGDQLHDWPTQYRLKVRYMDQFDIKLNPGSQAWFGDDNFVTAFLDGNPFPMDGVQFKESYPGQTQTLDNYSRSITETVGASAGFFGGDMTGSVSVSESVTTSHSWSVPSVSVDDMSVPSLVDKTFHLNTMDARSHTFEMTVQHVVSVVDDTKGIRTQGDPNARVQNFEIQIWPEVINSDLETALAGSRLFGPLVKMRYAGGRAPRQIIRVPAPPLPKGVTPSSEAPGPTPEEAADVAREEQLARFFLGPAGTNGGS